MTAAANMLKPTEAAVVALVAVRDVNRVIDERILPEANPARGRPRSGGAFPKGAVIIADRQVPRRRKAGRSGLKDWELKRLILEGDWTFVTKNAIDFRGPASTPGSKGQYADVAIHLD